MYYLIFNKENKKFIGWTESKGIRDQILEERNCICIKDKFFDVSGNLAIHILERRKDFNDHIVSDIEAETVYEVVADDLASELVRLDNSSELIKFVRCVEARCSIGYGMLAACEGLDDWLESYEVNGLNLFNYLIGMEVLR